MYSDPLQIYLAGNCSSKNVLTMLAKCGGATSDFFLWVFANNQIYSTPVRDLADLQERMYVAVNDVRPRMLYNTWVEFEYRLDISRSNNGSHVEVYGT